jgi:hypothetical protein
MSQLYGPSRPVTGIALPILAFHIKSESQSKELWAGQLGFDSQQGQVISLHHIQTSSGAHPAFYPMGAGDDFLGGKVYRCEADHLPPSSAKVKNGGAIPPLSHMSSWRGT